MHKVVQAAFADAGLEVPDGAAYQCMKWTHHFAPILSERLGCSVWPTLGQIWHRDRMVFSPTWRDFARWAHSGIDATDFHGRAGLNVHAWMTLETGDIVDLTFLETLAKFNPDAYGCYSGSVLAGPEHELLENHRFFPMFVGADAFEAIASLSRLPLLADSPDDLNRHPVVLVAG